MRRAGRCGRGAIAALSGLAVALLAACHEPDAGDLPVDTGFPGQVSAGGGSSGQVMAAHGGLSPAIEAPAGTPGVPAGKGGNTAGAGMGGHTAQSAASAGAGGEGVAVSATGTATPASAPRTTAGKDGAAKPPAADKAAKEQQEKQQLAQAMDRVAADWRARAAEQGWQRPSPTPVDAAQGFEQSASQSGPSGQPQGRLDEAARQPIRSEKHGTARPSADVKDPAAAVFAPPPVASAPDKNLISR